MWNPRPVLPIFVAAWAAGGLAPAPRTPEDEDERSSERSFGCQGQHRHYPPEFEREAVQLYRSSGKSFPKTAEELGVATESLISWIRQHEIDKGEREGLSTDEREELRGLRRENRTLEQERE